MKAKITFLAAAVCLGNLLMAQATVISNNSTDPNDFLGWNAFTTTPLEIKHDNNNSNIRFATNNSDSWGVRYDGRVMGGTVSPIQNGRLNVRVSSISPGNWGIIGIGTSERAIGGDFYAGSGNNNVGLAGYATDTDTETVNYGITGVVDCQEGSLNIAVYGANRDTSCLPNIWAGYFNGPTFCPLGAWTASDENLKSNVNPLTEAHTLLSALEPKQYEFQQQESNDLILPAGLQFGLLAQELEAVIPSAVTEVVHPGGLDDAESGNETLTFLGVNYQLLIPVLLASFIEQEAALQEAIAKLTVLEDAVQQIENRVAIEKYNIIHSD